MNAISFTGSVGTGRKIAATCVSTNPMKKIQLEMGGKNPLVVLDDADLRTAVECAANGAFFSTGQRCTASSRLIVTEGIHDRFVAALTERLKGLVVDDALKSEDPSVKRFLGVTPGYGKAVGVDEKWMYNVIKQVGNYGESYDRHVGPATPLKLDRAQNALWTKGGLMYAIPFR